MFSFVFVITDHISRFFTRSIYILTSRKKSKNLTCSNNSNKKFYHTTWVLSPFIFLPHALFGFSGNVDDEGVWGSTIEISVSDKIPSASVSILEKLDGTKECFWIRQNNDNGYYEVVTKSYDVKDCHFYDEMVLFSSDDTSRSYFGLKAVIDAADVITLIWVESLDSNCKIHSARYENDNWAYNELINLQSSSFKKENLQASLDVMTSSVTVVWKDVINNKLQAITHNGFTWGAVQTLSLNGINDFRVKSDEGVTAVVWHASDANIYTVQGAYYKDGSWQATRDLFVEDADTAEISDLRLVLDNGIATAAWICHQSLGYNQVQSARHDLNGWSEVQTLSSASGAYKCSKLRLASHLGKTTAAWVCENPNFVVQAARHDGSDWENYPEKFKTISSSLQEVWDVRIGSNDAKTLVVWAGKAHSEWQIQTVAYERSWAAPESILYLDEDYYEMSEGQDDSSIIINIASSDDKLVVICVYEIANSRHPQIQSAIYFDSTWFTYHFNKISKKLSDNSDSINNLSLVYHPISKHFIAWWIAYTGSEYFFVATMNPLNKFCLKRWGKSEGDCLGEITLKNVYNKRTDFKFDASQYVIHGDGGISSYYRDDNCQDLIGKSENKFEFVSDYPIRSLQIEDDTEKALGKCINNI